MNVHIHLEYDWTWWKQIAVKGSAFSNAKEAILSRKVLAETFRDAGNADIFYERIRALNGFFAVVIHTSSKVFAAVDRVRSIPLFYAVKGTHFYLSDNARWIWDKLGYPVLDPYSAAEFLLTGYVTGNLTLVNGIKQLQAGEILIFDVSTGTVELERYYRFLHREINEGSKEEFLECLDVVTQNSIERLVRFANGRPIVIPLSGGLDSRLIAMQLRKQGYPNIIAFSYGRPGNAESEVSRQVAEQLKIPWKFIPYSHDLWREWYNSVEYSQYVKRADGLCSVAHIQDWPAVWVLLRKGEIPADSVFVPGHSADFVAGSHIPPELLPLRRVDIERVVQSVWNHHYLLIDVKYAAAIVDKPTREVLERLKVRIRELIDNIFGSSLEEAISAYENWDWQERQAKFIVNSVRVYDFWGCEWWLPLWDREFIDFWRTVPLHLRINKNLYDTYVASVQQEINIKLVKSNVMQQTKAKVKEVMYKTGLGNLVQQVYFLKRSIRATREYREHPLAWYGVTSMDRFKQFIGLRGNINTILAIGQLEALKNHLAK